MSNDHSSHGYQNQQLQLAVMETLIFTSFPLEAHSELSTLVHEYYYIHLRSKSA